MIKNVLMIKKVKNFSRNSFSLYNPQSYIKKKSFI